MRRVTDIEFRKFLTRNPQNIRRNAEKTRVWYFKLALGLIISYVHKIIRKAKFSHPLIRTSNCAYVGVRNVSFSKNFADVLNE